MTEQELIQENEKLNQRLTKAIEVFKEQKENIVRLTQERDEAKGALDKKEATITELRTKLDEKSSSDEKFFEQVNEIQGLKRRVQELENAFDDNSYFDICSSRKSIISSLSNDFIFLFPKSL